MTELRGPYELDSTTVEKEVSDAGPGAYALGEPAPQFKVRRIGRSDEDLGRALHARVREYPQFKFVYAATAKQAFELECELFHDHLEDLSKPRLHPARLAGSRWQCPRCVTFNY